MARRACAPARPRARLKPTSSDWASEAGSRLRHRSSHAATPSPNGKVALPPTAETQRGCCCVLAEPDRSTVAVCGAVHSVRATRPGPKIFGYVRKLCTRRVRPLGDLAPGLIAQANADLEAAHADWPRTVHAPASVGACVAALHGACRALHGALH
eukprot:scaffold122872_cov75-Phaeocystis_antarctica.AAC.2